MSFIHLTRKPDGQPTIQGNSGIAKPVEKKSPLKRILSAPSIQRAYNQIAKTVTAEAAPDPYLAELNKMDITHRRFS